jgi:hypothetical protein
VHRRKFNTREGHGWMLFVARMIGGSRAYNSTPMVKNGEALLLQLIDIAVRGSQHFSISTFPSYTSYPSGTLLKDNQHPATKKNAAILCRQLPVQASVGPC